MWKRLGILCSQPAVAARYCRAEENILPLVKTALLTLLICSAVFGLVLGSTRDLEQGIATAVKLPTVWVIALGLCAPAYYAIAAILGDGIRFRALAALLLIAVSRASLVMFALLPVLWLAADVADYHQVTSVAAFICGVSGIAALGVLVRGFAWHPRMVPMVTLFGLVFFVVTGQTAWSLRPFVGRPSQTDVPVLRAPEGVFLDATRLGLQSARGIYISNDDAIRNGG